MAKKKKTKKSKASGKPVKFISTDLPEQENEEPTNTYEVADRIRSGMTSMQKNYENLAKSVRPITVREEYVKEKDRNKIVFSARSYEKQLGGVDKKPWRRLSDTELKELSQLDPYISAIISTRSNQGQVIGRRSESKFDKGTRIMDNYPLSLDEFNNRSEFTKAQASRERHKKTLLDWVLTCGTRDEEILDSAYYNSPDKTFKKCSFSEFLSAQLRNLLTFGRCGTQVFRDENGLPQFFRPIPIETIEPVIEGEEVHIGTGEETTIQSIKDVEEYNKIQEEFRPKAYVQKVDGRNVNFFTEEQLKVTYFQKQALFDLRGYPLSPIELAMYMVFIHQNTLGYMRNQFVKGLGTKGVLALEADDASAELSKEDLDELRREFHNFLNRTDNSATLPVISGPVRVNYIPLTSVPRDMEFLQIEEHVIRSLCASMQTSPQEMGYGHLSINQGGLTQQNKQDEIIQGEERGLRTILDVIFDTVNEIVFECFDDLEDKFNVSYTGVGEDTKDAVISRGTQELQTTATMNSLWKDSEKADNIPYGGDVPLSTAFHQNVVRYMKMGQFLEMYFGEKDASKNPLYDFFIDPTLDQAYMQRVVMTDDMQREQGELQLAEQKTQLEQMSIETMAEEQQMGMNDAAQAGMAGQDPEGPGPHEPPEPYSQEHPGDLSQSQTLEEAFMERQRLRKSAASYFSEWVKNNS